jgi:hypothetical protein
MLAIIRSCVLGCLILSVSASEPPSVAARAAQPPVQDPTRAWFAKAGADGDGSAAARPLGSTAALEAKTGTGDLIVLLTSDRAFDGGLKLKPGQTLIGRADAGRLPTITNSKAEQNNGHGIILADGVQIWNIRVENTHASGIFGADVASASIARVEVVNANQAAVTTPTTMRIPGMAVPHGGILLLGSRADLLSRVIVTQSAILDATGAGIGAIAQGGARNRLVLIDTRVEGGARIGLYDFGVMGVAEGASSDVQLELSDVRVLRRMSGAGRNVIVFAIAGARAGARVDGSYIGESGQDGVIALAALQRATAEIDIRNSIVENAAQVNVEGAVPPVLPSATEDANQPRVSVNIAGSTIRNAGAVAGFEQFASNIALAGLPLRQPSAHGRLSLTVRNSTIEGAKQYGVLVGRPGSPSDAADESEFDILFRENTIAGNGSAELAISAPNISVDARRNCWGDAAGLRDSRITRTEKAERAHIDASEPTPCPVSR